MAVPWKAICSAFRELNKSIFKASFSDWAVLSHFNCAILICTLFSFLPCWKPEVHFKGTSHLSPFPVASQCFEPLAQQLVSKASVLYQRKKTSTHALSAEYSHFMSTPCSNQFNLCSLISLVMLPNIAKTSCIASSIISFVLQVQQSLWESQYGRFDTIDW